jgi:hypothetical protein
MALRADRKVLPNGSDIHYFMNEVAERGIIVTHDTAGSGHAMDDDAAVVKIPTGTGDGEPAGLLLNDVVNLDLTRQHINWHKDEMQIGGKVTILTHGWVVTDQIKSGDTPNGDEAAYFDANGEITVTAGSPKIGKFLSKKDADGFAKVEVAIP